MASEPATSTRDAALRRLLVDRVEATAKPHGTSAVRAGTRSRLQTGLVTAFVSVGVVAVSAAALVLSQTPQVGPAGATGHGAGPDTGSSAPATSSPTPTPAGPAPTSSTPLIRHAGWHDITRDQLHTYVTTTSWGKGDPTNGAIWEEQAWLDKRCMASKGYLYDPIRSSQEIGTLAADSGLTAEQLQGYEDAMYGPSTDGPYDWRTAGCHGRSVHETGQDNAH